MNLKQKELLNSKLETLTELLNCLDPSLIYNHSEVDYNVFANRMLADLLAHFCHGDQQLALNMLLRMLKKCTHNFKGELNA